MEEEGFGFDFGSGGGGGGAQYRLSSYCGQAVGGISVEVWFGGCLTLQEGLEPCCSNCSAWNRDLFLMLLLMVHM